MSNSKLIHASVTYSAHSIGKKNGPHEDAHYEDTNSGLFIIADGMGGDKRGSLASRIAVEFISRSVDSMSPDAENTRLFENKEGLSAEENFLRMAFLHANAKIIERIKHEQQSGRPEFQQGQWMGCSAIAAWVLDNKLILVSMGNCRGYLFRKGRVSDPNLTQVIEEASLAQYKKWFPVRSMQNIPLNFLGKSLHSDIDQSCEKSLKEGDLYILITPGITNALSHEKILELVEKNFNDIDKLSNNLVLSTSEKCPTEDATALILSISSVTY